jgi:DNA topoisomerase-1
MKSKKEPIFDPEKAKQVIEKGRRARWWQRKGSGSRGFTYVDSAGKKVTDADALERIRALVIPPAWKHVRIAPSSSGRLQAIGQDAAGRIQYLYHRKFQERQERKKFAKIEKFGEHIPRLRKMTNEHIELDGFPREKVLAIMMRLINSLYMRVGTETSARHYKTYGITTLQNRHLTVDGKGKLVFDYVGKSHVKHRKVLVDEELGRLMKELKELGGARKLFHYVDAEGKARPIRPSELNEYLKNATSPEFSTKDFRTWGGTLLTAIELAEMGSSDDKQQIKKNMVKAIKKVAEQLGNTPSVCRSSYVHPKVLRSYEAGITLEEFQPRRARRIHRIETDYAPEEKALLKLFRT